jgi:Protein of unknown function (DUF1552)
MFTPRKPWQLDRRTFLRSAGVSLALPWLEAMGARSSSLCHAGEMTPTEIPRRAYFSVWGFFNNRAVPKETGKNYALPAPFDVLKDYRDDFTMISGLKVFNGSHSGPGAFLTGANAPGNTFRLISVDQQIAEHYKGKTRVPSLVLGLSRSTGFGGPYWTATSWTAYGTPIAAEDRPDAVFNQLFRVDDPKARAARDNQLTRNASILDEVKDQAKQLEKTLGKDDRATLDQYFTSIRDVEERIQTDRAWIDRPKPVVEPIDFGKTSPRDKAESNDDGSAMRRYLRLYFDVIALAFQTDSTRVVAHNPKGESGPTFKDLTKCPYDYHTLSHHGEDPDKLRWWTMVDRIYMEQWAYFLGKLKGIKEGQGTLLDHTMAVWGTVQGEAGHSLTDLPLLLCGGAGLGLKHQGHVAKKDVWIGSVWETMLDRIGMPVPGTPERPFQAGRSNGLIKEVL